MTRTLLGVLAAVVFMTVAGEAHAAPDPRPAPCREITEAPDLRHLGFSGAKSVWRLCGALDEDAEVYRFEVDTVDVDEERFDAFRRVVVFTLRDPRGWSAYGTGIRLEPVVEDGDFTVVLAAPEAVAGAHEVCSPHYSCRVGDTMWINERRWDEGVAGFEEAGATLLDYRRMVINHEVGHWLGFGHEECAGEGERAPVMQQQSIDLDGCRPNPWPLEHERAAVGDR